MSHFFHKCAICKKRRFFVSHRTYTMPKVSPKPITSQDELCGPCFRTIKKITL